MIECGICLLSKKKWRCHCINQLRCWNVTTTKQTDSLSLWIIKRKKKCCETTGIHELKNPQTLVKKLVAEPACRQKCVEELKFKRTICLPKCTTSGKQKQSMGPLLGVSALNVMYSQKKKKKQLWFPLSGPASLLRMHHIQQAFKKYENNPACIDLGMWIVCAHERVTCVYLCRIQTAHKWEAELLRDVFMANRFKHSVFPWKTWCRTAPYSLQQPRVFLSAVLYLHLGANLLLLWFSRASFPQMEWICQPMISSNTWGLFFFSLHVNMYKGRLLKEDVCVSCVYMKSIQIVNFACWHPLRELSAALKSEHQDWTSWTAT